MNRFRISLCLILLVAVGLGGCGQGETGKAQVWITRDRGATVLDSGEVPAGLTALQGLDRLAESKTGYGGAFVKEIDGVAGSRLHQRDWFFFVNGYEADRGAASYRLRAGDVEWWDYRSWHGSERVPVVVGAFPEPFLHGYNGKRRAAAVRFGHGLSAEAHALARVVRARSVAAVGRPVAPAANLLVVTSGRAGAVAELRSGDRAGEPVRFVVSGRTFARSLARDPTLVRRRYQAAGWSSSCDLRARWLCSAPASLRSSSRVIRFHWYSSPWRCFCFCSRPPGGAHASSCSVSLCRHSGSF